MGSSTQNAVDLHLHRPAILMDSVCPPGVSDAVPIMLLFRRRPRKYRDRNRPVVQFDTDADRLVGRGLRPGSGLPVVLLAAPIGASEKVGNLACPRNLSTTVFCDSVNCPLSLHPIEGESMATTSRSKQSADGGRGRFFIGG